MRRMWVVVFVLAGCGSVSDKPQDAAVFDSPVAVDASPDGPASLNPFAAPQQILDISTVDYSEDDPSITADGLELYFCSSRPDGVGAEDVWVSTRASTATAWATPIVAAGVNSTAADGNVEVSGDGLTLWLVSGRDGQTSNDIYVSTRANRTLAWSTPQLVAELNTVSNDGGPRVSTNGLIMYLVSDRAGGTTGSDIYRATRTAVGDTWGVPTRIDELSTNSVELNASSPALGDTLVAFSRQTATDGYDLHEATRSGGTFGTPRLMTELNTTGNDTDAELTDDGRTILFSRGGDIYTATR